MVLKTRLKGSFHQGCQKMLKIKDAGRVIIREGVIIREEKIIRSKVTTKIGAITKEESKEIKIRRTRPDKARKTARINKNLRKIMLETTNVERVQRGKGKKKLTSFSYSLRSIPNTVSLRRKLHPSFTILVFLI